MLYTCLQTYSEAKSKSGNSIWFLCLQYKECGEVVGMQLDVVKWLNWNVKAWRYVYCKRCLSNRWSWQRIWIYFQRETKEVNSAFVSGNDFLVNLRCLNFTFVIVTSMKYRQEYSSFLFLIITQSLGLPLRQSNRCSRFLEEYLFTFTPTSI